MTARRARFVCGHHDCPTGLRSLFGWNRRWLSLLLFLVIASPLRSQPASGTGFGVLGTFDANRHAADFQKLPGVPNCCPRFADGSGQGFSGGAVVDVPLSGAFSLLVRGSYASHNATLTSREASVVSLAGIPSPARIEHSIAARITSIGIEPLLGYRAFDEFRIHLGGRIGYVTGSSFDQKEILVAPANSGTFENGRRTRNEVFDQAIPDASPLFTAAVAGVSYRLPLTRNGALRAAPEAMYSHGLTPVASGLQWTMNSLNVGVTILYTPLPSAPSPAPVHPAIPVAPAPLPPALSATLAAVGVTAGNTEQPAVEVLVEEFSSTQLKPLLNYVFFDENSSTLPKRYRALTVDQARMFDLERLHREATMTVYYNLLNVIGYRLRVHPNAHLVVTGCNSGTNTETGRKDLSRTRAEVVAAYLTDVWGVEKSRVRVQGRELPEKASSRGEVDGDAENRRVELASDQWEILQPIKTKSMERRINPPVLRLKPSIVAEAGIQDWEISVRNASRELTSFSGSGAPPVALDWRLDEALPDLRGTTDSMRCVLHVKDGAMQQKQSAETSIPLLVRAVNEADRKLGNGLRIDRYNLILFDYDSPELNAGNQRIMDRMIRPELPADARILVLGTTDRTGEETYNLDLSRRRAERVGSAIGPANVNVRGLGEASPQYDDDLPEGRFYNRTVSIEVTSRHGR